MLETYDLTALLNCLLPNSIKSMDQYMKDVQTINYDFIYLKKTSEFIFNNSDSFNIINTFITFMGTKLIDKKNIVVELDIKSLEIDTNVFKN